MLLRGKSSANKLWFNLEIERTIIKNNKEKEEENNRAGTTTRTLFRQATLIKQLTFNYGPN